MVLAIELNLADKLILINCTPVFQHSSSNRLLTKNFEISNVKAPYAKFDIDRSESRSDQFICLGHPPPILRKVIKSTYAKFGRDSSKGIGLISIILFF